MNPQPRQIWPAHSFHCRPSLAIAVRESVGGERVASAASSAPSPCASLSQQCASGQRWSRPRTLPPGPGPARAEQTTARSQRLGAPCCSTPAAPHTAPHPAAGASPICGLRCLASHSCHRVLCPPVQPADNDQAAGAEPWSGQFWTRRSRQHQLPPTRHQPQCTALLVLQVAGSSAGDEC